MASDPLPAGPLGSERSPAAPPLHGAVAAGPPGDVPAGAARLAGPLATVREHSPLLVAIVVVGIAALPSLNFAYGPDQALFAYIGRALRQGRTLYVDLWDVKPPGIFWMYSLATLLPGEHRGLRLFDLAYTFATMTALYLLGRHLWGRAQGTIAALLYGVVYGTASGYWNMAQPDSFAALPVVGAVLLWRPAERGRPLIRAVAAGVLFGLAFQFRSVVALFPAVLVARALWPLSRDQARRALPLIGALSAGFVLMQAVTFAFLAVGGAVDEYLYAQLRFARHYAALGGPYAWDRLTWDNYLGGLRGATMWFVGSRLLLTAPALPALVWGGVLRADRGVRLTALLLAAALAGVAIQAKFFIYHWHLTLPFLALLAGWTAHELWAALRRGLSRARSVATAAAVSVALLLLTPQVTDAVAIEWQDLVRYLRQPDFRTIYYDRFGLVGHGSYSFRASEQVANYVRVRTKPGDRVFVWGYDPNFYLLSERESASRFLSLLPLMPTFTPEAWKEEFVRDLTANRPPYILIQRGENARWITGRVDDSQSWVTQFTAFQQLLDRSYQFDQRIEDYSIYRLRE